MRSEQILDIDAGNTAVKWRLEGVGAEDVSGRAPHGEHLQALKQVLNDVGAPERARIVSVAGAEFDHVLSAELKAVGIKQIDFAQVQLKVGSVSCGYQDPTQLGVDRWMAVLAAAESVEEVALAVIDVGSAITIDLVRADKKHLGGFILPGWRLLFDALYKNTAINNDRIPENYQAHAIDAGDSTSDAIGMGRLLSCVAPIEYVVTNFMGDIGSEVRVVCTGGDAERIMPLLSFASEYRPDLVLDGLRVALD